MNYARCTSLVGSFVAMVLLAAACGGSSISSEETEEPDAAASATGESDTTGVANTNGDDEASESSDSIASAVPTGCQAGQKPTGRQYEVTNIPAGDPDGGLVARFAAGSTSDPINADALPEGTIVDTSSDPADCFVTEDGAAWWNIGTPLLATGGWVNAKFLGKVEGGPESGDTGSDDTGSDEEADAHADCVSLPDPPDDCFPVFYVDNDITALDFEMTDELSGEFQYACVYQGFASACEVLAFIGPGDGIGNGLSQTPDSALESDCETLSGIDKKLACAELETR